MNKRNIKKIGAIVAILAIGVFGMTILSSSETETQKREAKPQIRTVNTEFVVFGDLNLEIAGNGIVESKSILEVVSEVSGKIDFAKNNLKDGTFVKKGETIVKVDAREIENNLYSLRSDFVNAVAFLLPDLKVESQDLYDKWFDYFSVVDIHKNIPQLPEISNLQEKIKLSSRQIFTKYYAVRNQEIQLSKFVIKAPFTGYIKSSGVIANSFISRGQHLYTIEDVHNLEIAIPLLVDEFNQIEFNKGNKVQITSDNTDVSLTGMLIRQDPKLDRNSQSLKVYVGFSNFEMIPEFLSGNYVNISITGKKLNNVAPISRHLVDNENYVYTIDEGKLARKKIDIVEVQKDKIIIANNFEKELEIVTTLIQKPLVGMQIKSLNHVVEIDSTDFNNDTVAVVK
jgi:multidrug efflux pump subunit AcrA (membrane-fusion protein)